MNRSSRRALMAESMFTAFRLPVRGTQAGARTWWGVKGKTPIDAQRLAAGVSHTGRALHPPQPTRLRVRGWPGGRLKLFFLPPYSPELNPDEQVWNYVKHIASAEPFCGVPPIVLSRLRSLQQLPWTVRMFFLTPDTQYAAL